jgi:anti-sigma regulatory factor (Ser/Thr protein kinase)
MTQWAIAVCRTSGIRESSAFALQLCLEEAVTNIMRHGERGARATRIIANVEQDGSDLVLTIEDDGSPFDPTRFPTSRARTLDEATRGGFGIGLMRRFARRVEYQRSRGRNQLRLTFARA